MWLKKVLLLPLPYWMNTTVLMIMFALPEVYENADKMQELMDRQAQLQDQIDAANAWELDTQLEIAMDALRTPAADQKIGVLSGGERRRVALVSTVASKT